MATIDEPVRGSIPPPWWYALPGLERIEALAQGYIEPPPLSRLMGIRPGHVGPGSGTWIMPAFEGLEAITGESEPGPLMGAAILGVASTILRPGEYLEEMTYHVSTFRPTRTQPGNLVARAQVVNTSRFAVSCEADIEDSQGRRVLSASATLRVCQMDAPPPSPPAELKRVEVPAYSTPDPYLRSFRRPSSVVKGASGAEMLEYFRQHQQGRLTWPFIDLNGFQFEKIELGYADITNPTPEWYAYFSRTVSAGFIGAFLHASWFATVTLQEKDRLIAPGTQTHTFLRPLPADGRHMRLEARAEQVAPDMIRTMGKVFDADGVLVAFTEEMSMLVDAGKRRKTNKPEPKRVLCTLLFTDIVGSTERAEELGDTKWRALLDAHHAKVRTAIDEYQGTEIDTAGDGFFIRFESPAQAIECARAVVNAVKPLGIEIRAGIHTGECEALGRDLSGMAVHIAARIQGIAEASEILVSSTVKSLVVGSGLNFSDRGEHELKGVPDTWALHSVV